MALTLGDLPPELVALIVTALVDIDGWSSPLSLAVTSSHYQDIVEDIIWRDLFIRTGRNVRNIWAAIRKRPKRATYVRKIDLRSKHRHEIGLQKLPKVLNMTHNLQELTIESPTCNYQRWRGDGNWPHISQDIQLLLRGSALQMPASLGGGAPALQMLKRLILHNNGDNSRYWNAPYEIFVHPSVEEMTLSCANITFETIEDAPKFTTPLKHLTLIECEVSHAGLSAMLAYPRALESLYLGMFLLSTHFACRDL